MPTRSAIARCIRRWPVPLACALAGGTAGLASADVCVNYLPFTFVLQLESVTDDGQPAALTAAPPVVPTKPCLKTQGYGFLLKDCGANDDAGRKYSVGW